jgi:hypothetical protein
MDSDLAIVPQKLQTNLLAIQHRFKEQRIKANGSKSVHATFITRRETCPSVHINNLQLPQEEDVKYVGLHFDRRLAWHKYIFAKWKQLRMTLTKMYWLLDTSQNSPKNNTQTYLDLTEYSSGVRLPLPIWKF